MQAQFTTTTTTTMEEYLKSINLDEECFCLAQNSQVIQQFGHVLKPPWP